MSALSDCRASPTVVLGPATASIRILSIDGGGVRGVITLEFLRFIQDTLGPGSPIQSFLTLLLGRALVLLYPLVFGYQLIAYTGLHCLQEVEM